MGIWTTVSGAAAQAQNLDIIANNLANGDTNGYKKDIPTFKEVLHNEHQISQNRVGLGGTTDQSSVVTDGTYTHFQQGNLRITENKWDLAIDGPGFLEILTPKGIQYTRQGSLKIDPDGKLVTAQGFPVLAAETKEVLEEKKGPENLLNPIARTINLRDRGPSFFITESGELYTGDDLIAKINTVEFKDLNKLRKTGAQSFINQDPSNQKLKSEKTTLHQGMLETSNVNPVEEMVNMITANRLFEQDLKALKTYGELMSKEVNEVGKL